ncbi:hypothetical protein V6N12_042505 [Hibiscus sabdariffa]|uniref:Uncharacterized protein n=1 Tax=Hibiscus sabdariffa TaxID=183260 RepID=A0ABR2EEZ7_9ROSI
MMSRDPRNGGSNNVRKRLRLRKSGSNRKLKTGVVEWVKSTQARIDASIRNVDHEASLVSKDDEPWTNEPMDNMADDSNSRDDMVGNAP